MNQVQRALLRRALVALRNNNAFSVCNALDYVTEYDPLNFVSYHEMLEACYHLKRYINNAINGLAYLESWQDNHDIPRGAYNSRQQQHTRIQWVRWMLGEL